MGLCGTFRFQVFTQNIENSVFGYKEDCDEQRNYIIRFGCPIFIIGQIKKKKTLKQVH